MSMSAFQYCNGWTATLLDFWLNEETVLLARVFYHKKPQLAVHRLPSIPSDSSIDEIPVLWDYTREIKFMPVVCQHENFLAVASSSLQVELVDQAGRTSGLFSGTGPTDDPLSAILSDTEKHNVILCGLNACAMSSVDVRSGIFNAVFTQVDQFTSSRWHMCMDGNSIYAVSNHNKLMCVDKRYPTTSRYHVDITGPCWNMFNKSRAVKATFGAGMLAFSGMDNLVRLYDLTHDPDVSQGAPLSPIFSHDGHLAEPGEPLPSVTDHSHNEVVDDCIVSVTESGQIHSWILNTNYQPV